MNHDKLSQYIRIIIIITSILLIIYTIFAVYDKHLYYDVNPIKVIITSDKSYSGLVEYHILNVTLPDKRQYQFTLSCNYYNVGSFITITKSLISSPDWSVMKSKLPKGCE